MQYDRQMMPMSIPIEVDFDNGSTGDTHFTYTAERDFVIRDITIFVSELINTGGHVQSVELNGVEIAVFTSVQNDPIGTVMKPDTAIITGTPKAVTAGDTIEFINKANVAQNGKGYYTLWVQEER